TPAPPAPASPPMAAHTQGFGAPFWHEVSAVAPKANTKNAAAVRTLLLFTMGWIPPLSHPIPIPGSQDGRQQAAPYRLFPVRYRRERAIFSLAACRDRPLRRGAAGPTRRDFEPGGETPHPTGADSRHPIELADCAEHGPLPLADPGRSKSRADAGQRLERPQIRVVGIDAQPEDEAREIRERGSSRARDLHARRPRPPRQHEGRARGAGLRALAHAASSLPPTKASWSARTASSTYFSSITTEILISLVLMSWMLMPSRASTWNMRAATPAWSFMPRPTTETLPIAWSPSTSRAPTPPAACSASARARW